MSDKINFTKIKYLLFLFLGISFKVNAQNLSFFLQTSPLTFDYSSLSDFNSPRPILKAFTLNITNTRIGRYNIYCKIQPISSQYTSNYPLNMFSIRLNSANYSMPSSYFQETNLGLSDVLIGNATNRARRQDVVSFDLILNPIGFDVQPNNLNYSFIFTVTEY